jgi:3-methyladenine DNA glycosylase AlkD
MNVEKQLIDLKDEKYKEFISSLIPNIKVDTIIGIRVPQIRKLAKSIQNSNETNLFLATLPHKYFESYMLHGVLLSYIRDYDTYIDYLDQFLPYVDNWAVCDIISNKIVSKHLSEFYLKIIEWLHSSDVYEIRFAIRMMMEYFLDNNFKIENLEIIGSINNDDYYVKMMIAWFFATALAKNYDDTYAYLANCHILKWTMNKIVQKARESYRISPENKLEILKLKK